MLKRIEGNMNPDSADVLTNGRHAITDELPRLEFTGERVVPGKTVEGLFREHEVRYVFAVKYVAGKDVLDVACGSGVGSSLLRSAGARRVLGVDLDGEAVAYAKARYTDCEFELGDASNLRLADESVDVVVSFETLEHLNDQVKFLSECRRVLRPGGMLICSTPNRSFCGWYGTNPYHSREFRVREFVDLVGRQFCVAALFSQREKLYPAFVVRRVVARLLALLGIERLVKGALGINPTPSIGREEFSLAGDGDPREIRPYRESWLRQPTFLLVVAVRKDQGDVRMDYGGQAG